MKNSYIPDSIILAQAQELLLHAQYLDKANQFHVAILSYIQVIKIFNSLCQQFPKLSLSNMWRRESMKCVKHIRRICNEISSGPLIK